MASIRVVKSGLGAFYVERDNGWFSSCEYLSSNGMLWFDRSEREAHCPFPSLSDALRAIEKNDAFIIFLAERNKKREIPDEHVWP